MERRLSRQDAQRLLRQFVVEGKVILHPHLLNRMIQRNITQPSVDFVLEHGIVRREPEFDIRFRQWRYLVEGPDAKGQNLRLVFTFLDEGQYQALVVTVMD